MSRRLALAALALAACKGEPDPTYWQDVGPLIAENCMTCHRDGGIAPFALETYDDAVEHGPEIAAATAARIMPPFLVTADGTCGDFAHDRWLSDDEIDTIDRWVHGGMDQGEPVELSPPVLLATLVDPVVLTTPQYVPARQGGQYAQYDDYRCFLIDPELDQTAFLTGYEVAPGNDAIVHHVLVMPVTPSLVVNGSGETNAQVMARLDADSPNRLGWECFGLAGEDVAPNGVPVTWAPGQGTVEFPAESGVRINPGDQLVVQVHYNLVDDDVLGESDSTTLRLRLDDTVAREAFLALPDPFLDTLFDNTPATLAPGQASVAYQWTLPAGAILRDYTGLLWSDVGYLDLYGVMPHMHERGRQLDLTVGDTCAAEVLDWDFHWQWFYLYDTPIRIDDPTTRITVTCTFDTRDAEEPVMPGWGTQNEMCLTVLYLVAP